MARTDDLWRGYRRTAAHAMPTPAEVADACDAANIHAQEEMTRSGGNAEPVDAFMQAADVSCTPEAGSAATAMCRFRGDWIPLAGAGPPRKNWPWRAARLVHATGEGRTRWITRTAC